MSVLAQGTHIYFIDPDTDEAVRIECATSFNPGGNPADQLEEQCLEYFDRVYKPGLRTPGQATMGINPSPDNSSHLRLYELSQENPSPTLQFAIGWSDGTDAPTVDSSGDFDLPATRTWFTFDGYVSDYPFDFQYNTFVSAQVTIQRSGPSAWTPKVSP